MNRKYGMIFMISINNMLYKDIMKNFCEFQFTLFLKTLTIGNSIPSSKSM